ncbi:MAG: hypothetical protein WEB58_20020 [Planctomycetaceae bacterium]
MVSFPSLVVGAFVALLGGALLVSHQQSFARRKLNGALEEFEHQFHVRQYRRRMQTSGMLVLIGVLIIGGDAIVDWNAPNRALALSWVALLLLLSLWVMLLALGDWFSSRMHHQTLMAHNVRMQELHKKLLETASKQENGQASPTDGAPKNDVPS